MSDNEHDLAPVKLLYSVNPYLWLGYCGRSALSINFFKENIMGMRVGGSSAGWSGYQTNTSVSGWQQRQQGMKDLFSSLQSGNLASAQKAFAGVQNNAGSGNSALTKVGDALQAGDLAGAQQAAKAMHAGRGGHHHARAAAQTSDSTSSTTTGATAEASSADTAFNTFITNLEAALTQQGQTTAGANGQGSFLLNMPPPPPPAMASTGVSSPATTQAFLDSRSTTPSNAQLEASLESLIQQMSDTPGVTTDASTASSGNVSVNSNLQSSFANLIGAMGGQSATASVSNFLQGLNNKLKSMDAAASTINTTA
jgi:hypothetical protein